MAPTHSLLHCKINDAFVYIVNVTGFIKHVVVRIGERSFCMSVNASANVATVDCVTEREALVSLHNILLFNDVDTLYFVNKSSDEAVCEMNELYKTHGMATWVWGLSHPGSLLFQCRGIVVADDDLEWFSTQCHHYERPTWLRYERDIEFTIHNRDIIYDVMSLIELVQCYVTFTPLTYNEDRSF
jgi:hypothetical protein